MNSTLPPKVVAAFDAILSLEQAVYINTGGVPHQLFGVEFNGDAISGFYCADVPAKQAVGQMLAFMLSKWGMAVHVFEGWASKQTHLPPSKSPDRESVVNITIHTESAAYVASCPADESLRLITKVELIEAEGIGGTMGRSLPVRH